MASLVGTTDNPLRVAIIGSGPSAFYAAEHLQKQRDMTIIIDMFERLPTPFGLVRGGVAPDHQKIKSVTKVYERIAEQPGFRFFGNVTFGKDIVYNDLAERYHAIIYAVGTQTDRRMDIPGEDLPGSHAATEFVGWYNAHPDYHDRTFDLSGKRVAVIGNGNVAMDVIRILARTEDELHSTDIADYALEALSNSGIKTLYLLGRRGPAQGKFTPPELKELQDMAGADIVVSPDEIKLDPLSEKYIQSGEDRAAVRNLELLTHYAQNPTDTKPKKIVMRFLVSPVEVLGTGQVEAIRLVKNEICEKEHMLRPCPTDEFEILPVDLVFRSIGYHGVPLPGVPFNEKTGTIRNDHGRVTDDSGTYRTGEYAVGWIKRGPSGIIGTNKPDAQETVTLLLEDVGAGRLLAPAHSEIESLLAERGIRFVTYDDWRLLDQLEQTWGDAVGRPRVKFYQVEDMLHALADHADILNPQLSS
ncbi:MAG: FAD-dependent oxidoreductase [Anaerolineae bacterium]|nr:FAD-dependent oxidoreductase [Anaerolineae bacterium]